MKNYLIIFLLILFISVSSACLAQVKLTLYGGPVFTYAKTKNQFSYPRYYLTRKNRADFHVYLRGGAGLRLSVPLKDNLDLESGVRFSRKDSYINLVREEQDQFYYRSQWGFKVKSWEVPVTIAYQPDFTLLGRNVTLRGGLVFTYNNTFGPYNLKGIDFFYPSPTTAIFQTYYTFDGYRNLNSGAEVGLAFESVLLKNLELGVTYHADFKPTFKAVRFENELIYRSASLYIVERMHGSFTPRLTSYLMFHLGYTFSKKKVKYGVTKF